MQKLIILISFSLLLGACSLLPDVYTVPRYQGNIVEQKMIDQLAPGMSRDQVTFIMGTPLIQDPFFPDRWDYVYTTQVLQQNMTEERLTLFFNGDSLASLQGDFKPEPIPEGVVVDDLPTDDEEKQTRAPSAQSPGEDTTIYKGGSVNAIKPEGTVTETVIPPKPAAGADPYTGLTPDGHVATPTPTAVPAH